MNEKCECYEMGFMRHEIINNKCVDCLKPIFESVEVTA